MIVGTADRTDRSTSVQRTTLDDLFRRAAVRNPDALALVDPEDRSHFTTGDARQMSYAQADRAVWAIAARLRALGLQTDSVIGVQVSNTVESALTMLGVLRAGMIAAPLPMLWRETEIIAALSSVGAKALVTTSRIGGTDHGAVAGRVAAGLFSIRHVCAYGENLPDGFVSLDESLAGRADMIPSPQRDGDPAAHAAVVTFEPTSRGFVPMARNHSQLIAAGRSIIAEIDMPQDGTLLSAMSCASLAGLGSTFVPWLLTGGRLVLHQPFDADLFAAQARAHGCDAVVVPGPLAAAFDLPQSAKLIALWRAPERLSPDPLPRQVVDVTVFGEVGFHAARRKDGGDIVPMPLGRIETAGSSAAIGLESKRSAKGTLLLRGAMVPVPGFGGGETPGATDDFVETGYPCRIDPELGSLIITGPQAGMIGIGGYRIARSEIDAFAAALPTDSPIAALPDGLLGQRLRGRAADPAAAMLAARGANPLIAGAFQAAR